MLSAVDDLGSALSCLSRWSQTAQTPASLCECHLPNGHLNISKIKQFILSPCTNWSQIMSCLSWKLYNGSKFRLKVRIHSGLQWPPYLLAPHYFPVSISYDSPSATRLQPYWLPCLSSYTPSTLVLRDFALAVPLPGTLFPQIFAGPTPSLPPGFCLTVTFSVRPNHIN